jgi:hypothetical protein
MLCPVAWEALAHGFIKDVHKEQGQGVTCVEQMLNYQPIMIFGPSKKSLTCQWHFSPLVTRKSGLT